MDEGYEPESTHPDPRADGQGGFTEDGPEPGRAVATGIPVAGIGASAGGLEVFKRLLADLPTDTGLAIVFVQHLDQKHSSMLTKILAGATPMPVIEAAEGMRVEANHVYVIPPDADLTIAQGALRLVPRTQTPGLHMPIDRFLRSLADECGPRAVAVILSGTGTDGSAGVQAVRASGGTTFAQDQDTAKFPGMPQAAVATGSVDFVLPPERIAGELVRIARHQYVSEAGHPERLLAEADVPDRFAPILDVLHSASGIDFSLYRENTVRRRILRRLALRNIESIEAYKKLLENDPGETKALERDLLISVTSFFRDPESFESLKKTVFPRILQGRPANATVRVWVPGCATGEEAFSIAILFQEYLYETGMAFPLQIFASDISQPVIDMARSGRYLENIAADVSPERLNRYFVKVEGGYLLNKSLREMCVFSRHNLIDDPPFSKLDLISCRNVLIYLGSVQKSIIPVFHYALKPAGYLMLGASETALFGDLFSLVDPQHRIYAKRETPRRPHLFLTGDGGGRKGSEMGKRTRSLPVADVWEGEEVRREVDRILLSKYNLAGVVVDENLEVQEIRGEANSYLTLPAGRVSYSLVKLIPDAGLFLEVERMVRQVRQNGETVQQDSIRYERDGKSGEVNIRVVPLHGVRKLPILVLFEPAGARRDIEPAGASPKREEPGDGRDLQISRLKRELAEMRQRYLAVIEEHQTTIEDSQSRTEEALSTSEELQSLNEELETAKEELQSTNEELITVNDELQTKNAALVQARDFAISIVETVRHPLIVLDTELRIKMGNRAFYRTFQVSPLEAEGRIIYALSDGAWDLPGLRDSLNALGQGDNSFSEYEIERDFPSVGRKVIVLGGRRIDHLNMILVAVDDITARKDAEKALRKGEEHLRQAQKMEAIGRLAGGIAHDFNNLLTAIIGYSSLLLETLTGNDRALWQVREIRNAGESAASLTQQLLSFSRRQVLQPKVLDLNGIVQDFDGMLRRLVSERIKVAVHCAPEPLAVRADPGEIGRAIMNLALNARDAMPGSGTLTIETAGVTLSETAAKERNLAPGRYATLAVSDNGIGMDAELQNHIFEPFFTTKDIGKGTGLGLATVQGIVEQSGGAIRCESEPGRGTTFRIFLPAVLDPVGRSSHLARGLAQAPKGSETLLLVEDEDAVRGLARMILSESGYTVLEARNGREGLAVCETHPGTIHLLVTDVVMPMLGGRELAEAATLLRPGMKVLFVSGHTQDVVLKEGVKWGAAFLQKPFTPTELAQTVRETLDLRPMSGLPV